MSRYDEGITDYVLKDMTEVVRMDSGTRMVENNSSMFLVNISHCPTATLEELEGLEQLSRVLVGGLQLALSTLGLIGNTLSIVLLSSPLLRTPFNQLLRVLACFDLVYLVTMILESMRKLGLETWLHLVIFPQFLHPLNAIAMMGSIYLTVGVALERYMAVYNPLAYNRRQQDTTKNRHHLLTYLLPILLFAVLFNITKFFESKVVYYTEDNVTSLYLDVTQLRLNNHYVTWYVNWARLCVLGILPFGAITFLNTKIYIAVRRRMRSRSRKNDHMSIILMLIVTVFVICNLPRLILNMHEITVIDDITRCKDTDLGGFPVWSILLGFFSHIFLVINSSINLLIYCLVGAKFRTVFCQVVCCKGPTPCQCLQLTSEGGRCVACGRRMNGLQTVQRSGGHSHNSVEKKEDIALQPSTFESLSKPVVTNNNQPYCPQASAPSIEFEDENVNLTEQPPQYLDAIQSDVNRFQLTEL